MIRYAWIPFPTLPNTYLYGHEESTIMAITNVYNSIIYFLESRFFGIFFGVPPDVRHNGAICLKYSSICSE